MDTHRLSDQIRFILEIDKLKGVIRRSYLVGVERKENSRRAQLAPRRDGHDSGGTRQRDSRHRPGHPDGALA